MKPEAPSVRKAREEGGSWQHYAAILAWRRYGDEIRAAIRAAAKQRKVAFVPEPDDKEVDSMIHGRSLDELRSIALRSVKAQPKSTKTTQNAYVRERGIAAYVRKRADGICEACGEQAPFKTWSGQPYLEVHHIRRLSDGGPDHPRWTIGLCPNCHRRAHYSAEKESQKRNMIAIVRDKESTHAHT